MDANEADRVLPHACLCLQMSTHRHVPAPTPTQVPSPGPVGQGILLGRTDREGCLALAASPPLPLPCFTSGGASDWSSQQPALLCSLQQPRQAQWPT